MFQSTLESNSLSHTNLLCVNLSHMVSKILAISVLLLFDLKNILQSRVEMCSWASHLQNLTLINYSYETES